MAVMGSLALVSAVACLLLPDTRKQEAVQESDNNNGTNVHPSFRLTHSAGSCSNGNGNQAIEPSSAVSAPTPSCE